MSARCPPLRALACVGLALVLAAGAARAEPLSARRGLEDAPDSFLSWIESLPEGQQRAALRRLGDMPTQRRDRLFQRWEALEEGERRALQQRMLERMERGQSAREEIRERLERMPPESREKLAPLVRRWREMGPDERRRMRERLERFRTLSPEDQQALIDKRFEVKSPAERTRILEALREASQALPRRPLLEAEPEPIEPAAEPR